MILKDLTYSRLNGTENNSREHKFVNDYGYELSLLEYRYMIPKDDSLDLVS